MVPMRSSRLLLALPVLVGVVAAIDTIAGVISSVAEQQQVAAAWLTGLLLLAYAWIAPWLHEFLAVPSTTGHAETRKLLAVALKRHAAAAGISTPRLVFVEHASPVAFGIGMPGAATVFVTTGMCKAVDARTLDFVIAHEVSHISLKHSLFQAIVFAGLYLGKALLGLPPLLAPFILLGYLAFMRQCEFAADCGASRLTNCSTTRHGLAALAQMVREVKRPSVLVDLLSTHPGFHRRIAASAPQATAVRV
jgi:Zn-dependent protease with chaperone function